jgi:hypothetical protein
MPTSPKVFEVAETIAPKILVADANMAQIVCDGAFVAHSEYHNSIANMIEQFDGKPPKDPRQLEKAGMDWVSNVPYRKGQSKIETVATARLNMYRASIYFSQILFKPWDEEAYKDKEEYFFLANPDLSVDYAQRLSQIFVETLHRDPHFCARFLTDTAINQVTWGYAISFTEEHCVFPDVPRILDIYFERADRPENIKCFIQVFYQRAADLYKLYEKEKARVDAGGKSFYILEGLEEALHWAVQLESQKNYNSWAAIVKTYTAGELGACLQRAPDISWAWIWNQEIQGPVTKTLYMWNRGLNVLPRGQRHPFLQGANFAMPNGINLSYQRTYKDKKLEDFWDVYPNTNVSYDRVIQNLRGLGIYAYEEDVQYNILRNAINDQSFLNATLFLQTEFGQQLEAVSITSNGPITILPPGFPVVKEDLMRNKLQSSLIALQYQDGEFQKLTQQYDPQVAGQLTDRATNQQVQQIAAEVNRERQDFSVVPRESLQRALKKVLKRLRGTYAKDDPGYDTWQYFKKRVTSQLMPPREWKSDTEKKEFADDLYEALLDAVDFVALDFLTDDLPGLQLLFELAPTPEGKEYYRRRLAFARNASYDELMRFFPIATDPAKNINDNALAYVENALFWQTGEIAYNSLQNPVTHLQAHLYKAIEVIRAVSEGQDPAKVFQWLSNMLPHAQLHLAQLATDPYQKSLFDNFQELFDNVAQQVNLVGRVAQGQASAAASQMEEQAAQQQAPDDGNAEAMAKIQLLQVQSEEKMRRTQEQSKFRAAQMAESQQARLQMQQQSHQQQMAQSAQRFALEQQMRVQQQQGNPPS